MFYRHKLTDEQIADAREHLGVNVFVPLPKYLQKMFSNVPPDLDAAGLCEYAEPFFDYIHEYIHMGEYVLVQGDFGLTFLLVNFLIEHGAIPLYATTERASFLDVKNPDGSITTQRIFRHKIFRRYI